MQYYDSIRRAMLEWSPTWSPSQLTGLKGWWDPTITFAGQANGTSISSWAPTQNPAGLETYENSNPTQYPTVQEHNGLKVVRADGMNDSLTSSAADSIFVAPIGVAGFIKPAASSTAWPSVIGGPSSAGLVGFLPSSNPVRMRQVGSGADVSASSGVPGSLWPSGMMMFTGMVLDGAQKVAIYDNTGTVLASGTNNVAAASFTSFYTADQQHTLFNEQSSPTAGRFANQDQGEWGVWTPTSEANYDADLAELLTYFIARWG